MAYNVTISGRNLQDLQKNIELHLAELQLANMTIDTMSNYGRRPRLRRQFEDAQSDYSSDASSHGRPVQPPSPVPAPRRAPIYSQQYGPSYVPRCATSNASNYGRQSDDGDRSESNYYEQRGSGRQGRTERTDRGTSPLERERPRRYQPKYEASGETYIGGGSYPGSDDSYMSRDIVKYGYSRSQYEGEWPVDDRRSDVSSESSCSTAEYSRIERMNDSCLHGQRQFDEVRGYNMEVIRPPGDVRRRS